MIKYNIDITQLKINDEVRFELPYLDSKLKFKGTVISIKTKTLVLKLLNMSWNLAVTK